MKKVLASAILALGSISAMASTVVTSDAFKYEPTLKAGPHTVSIIEKNDQKSLVVDGKNVSKIESFQANLNYSFKLGAEDLVLLSLSEGGNACPAMYSLVRIPSVGAVSQTEEFGTCSDIPKITVDSDKITFVFKRMSGKGTDSWVYADGKLSKRK